MEDADSRYKLFVKCDCGRNYTVLYRYLRDGRVKSCGCARAEQARITPLKHGECRKTAEYSTWRHIIDRCENPNAVGYSYYGGRGIRVCEKWRNSYEAFLADVGRRPSPKHSIERIDCDGHYEPGNVIWLLRSEQVNNRRNTVRLTVDGITRNVAEWSKISNIPPNLIRGRHSKGWSDKAAIYAPLNTVLRRAAEEFV
jgi:hypothetical protein